MPAVVLELKQAEQLGARRDGLSIHRRFHRAPHYTGWNGESREVKNRRHQVGETHLPFELPGEAGPVTFWRHNQHWDPNHLIVEVLGDDDTPRQLEDKVDDYQRFGVRMVWIADPRTRSVTLYPLGEPARTLQEGDSVGGGDILPGLSLVVASLFEVV